MFVKIIYSPSTNVKTLLLGAFFLLSAVLGAGVLAACDSGPSGGAAVPLSGEAVFAKYCNTCHPGGGRGAGPSLIQLSPRLSDEQIKNYVRNGKNRMPAFGPDRISDTELDSLVGYIRSLK